MSSVPSPNKSDIRRTAVDSDSKQPGGGTEGIVDSSLNEAPQWLRDLSDAQDWCHLIIGLVPNTVYPKGQSSYRCYDVVDISYNGGSDDDPYEGGVIARGCTPSRAVSRAIEKLRQS